MNAWREMYQGGSPEAERREFERLARLMMSAQLKSQKAAGARRVDRAFHAKALAATHDAYLRFADDLPEELRAGFAQPGLQYPTTVRFSNAASSPQADGAKDLRGVALRIQVSPKEQHDLLATNYPVSHARDARQFVVFAHALAGGTLSRIVGLGQLMVRLGPRETARMLRNIRAGQRPSDSLALETYWSRGAMRWGDEAVRFLLRPASGARPARVSRGDDANALRSEFTRRLQEGDVEFEVCIQRFVDEDRTPIEDTSIEWREEDAPVIPVGRLVLSRQDLTRPDALVEARIIEELAFNPWNSTDEFRPLGNLNRARKAVYDASAAHRLGYRWHREVPVRNRVLGSAARAVFRTLNRRVPWYRLPLALSLLNLESLRHRLRHHNLRDTEAREAPPRARSVPPVPDAQARSFRTFDGRDNDLSDPSMGAVGSTFGRNMAPAFDPTRYDEPNPVTVSNELMTRHSFKPATTVNILAAAWIQFQVHDWVSHERFMLGEHDVVIPLPPGAPDWVNTPGGPGERNMRLAGNIGLDGQPATGATEHAPFGNEASHWWDGSAVYGTTSEKAQSLRDGPKLRLEDGYLPTDLKGFEVTGFNESWWLGLSLMHTLFAREHNVVCDELRLHHPGWDDERIYQTARLIVSALIAKIHTVEWTPAILGTKAIDVGLKSNWYGPPANDWVTRIGAWLIDEHALKGIPETFPDHHSAPYSLTEEFTTVYRMHPLIPDDYAFFSHDTGEKRVDRTFVEIQGAATDEQLRELGLSDSLYSFGIAHPGAITLNNFPRALQQFERDGEILDLAVADIVRTRRRGVPRYNDFRRWLDKAPITRWEELTTDPETNQKLRELYGDIEQVDTVIGLLGETPPEGFGFSDTAFRIFILMASRRLQSDRFLTVDFRPEVYSQFGLDWIEQNSMSSLIRRHCPELAPMLPTDASAFAPWRPVIPGRRASQSDAVDAIAGAEEIVSEARLGDGG